MRALSSQEQDKVKILTKYQVSFTLIEPTETGLKKSIMDATGSVRSFLKSEQVHDYEQQGQGPVHKVKYPAVYYLEASSIEIQASLYRPSTKQGDPRIWFSRLNNYAQPNDIVGVIYFADRLHVFNLTQFDVQSSLSSNLINPLKELVQAINDVESMIARELLEKLRGVASRGPIPSSVAADTAVGRTLETALGIPINSSKQPDYKGIELKAFRGNRNNRKNLFAQVPNWELSKFKSSAEILDAFGYEREDDFKLYCTVSAITKNSQGLSLRLDSEINRLIENSDNPQYGDFVAWSLTTLHSRLQEKHKETFWVEAESTHVDGKEYFRYTMVEHTKKPSASQFDLLVDMGVITVDHLIKRNAKGKVVEKGPLFKIKPVGIELLFPPSERYDLMS